MATKKSTPAKPASKKADDKKKKNAWLKYSAAQLKAVDKLADEYKEFISKCKTERECVAEIVRQAKALGYKDLDSVKKVKTGDKLYSVNMGKAIVLFVVGSEPLEKGMKILGAHIDSPRIDIKQNPVYEDKELCLLDTHYYGGIKKYQWVTIPLAIHGVVCRKDGTTLNIVIGEDDKDPVIGISDLLIHLSQDQLKKDGAKVIEGEDLNILVGSIPLKDADKDAVKSNVLKLTP